jgi:hypothetical protein
MSSLTEPSEDLARKILGDVALDDALRGHSLQASGAASYGFTSMEHVAQFIDMSTLSIEPDELLLRGGNIVACFVKAEALQEWIGTVVGDTELCDAIGEVIAADNGVDSYPVFMQPITRLIHERVDQARGVLGITEATTIGAGASAAEEALTSATVEQVSSSH